MAGPPGPSSDEQMRDFGWQLALFFSFYILLVLMLGLWSRVLARRVESGNFHRSVRLFNQVMFGARIMIPVWFTVGVWGLGWGGALMNLLGVNVYRSAAGMLLGTMPAFATWMGLWWSQYPAERALREQNLLIEFDNDLPLYRPPPFRSYFFSNFRLQVLFTLVPVAMILLVRDLVMWLVLLRMHKPVTDAVKDNVEAGASLFAAATVFLFVPALLARVLNTRPMEDCPLRQRLDAICRRAGIRYRHILVWNTSNHVGNAAVMGVLPWLRYVLLSDVLLERMNDQQIEAVFAHEVGHAAHRHMTWYAIFFVAIPLAGALLYKEMITCFPLLDTYPAFEGICGGIGVAVFLLLFGALSRRCERQADVYAARTMEMLKSDEPPISGMVANTLPVLVSSVGTVAYKTDGMKPERARRALETPVGERGAAIFASALRRVAIINNIPIYPTTHSGHGFWSHIRHYADTMLDLAGNWLHGSIASRMEYMEHLATDARLTSRFDRSMFWMYWALIGVFVVSAVLSVAFGSI